MGYTVWYEGRSKTPITDAEKALVEANAAKWTTQLSETAESYSWEIEEDGCLLTGWTKPGLDEDEMMEDVDLIVDAVKELAEALPGFAFTVTDDYESELYP